MRHEVAVVGVGLVLSRVLGFKPMTARQIWDDFNRRYSGRHSEARLAMPDFLVDDARGLKHVVEVELTAKSRSRYRDIFPMHRRRLQNYDSRVLYLVDWPGGVEHITALGRKYESSCVQAAQLSEFQRTLGRCEFAPSYSAKPFVFASNQAKAAPLEPVPAQE